MTRSTRVVRMGLAILAILCGTGSGVWADLSNGGFDNSGVGWDWGPPAPPKSPDFVTFPEVEFFGSPSLAAVLCESPSGDNTYLKLEQPFQLLDGETRLRFDYQIDAEGALPTESDYLQVSLGNYIFDEVISAHGLTLANLSRQGIWSEDIPDFLRGQSVMLCFTLVSDPADSDIRTTVAIDNVSCAAVPVPVPGAVLLGAVGLICATWRLRRGAPRFER